MKRASKPNPYLSGRGSANHVSPGAGPRTPPTATHNRYPPINASSAADSRAQDWRRALNVTTSARTTAAAVNPM